jgi:ribose transport system permease protein
VRLSQRPWLGPLVALVVLYAVFAGLSPDTFARTTSLVVMARQTTVVAICAVGMTFVIIHGGIDLSVGSGVALTTVVIATLLRAGAAPLTAVFAGIAVMTASGFATALLVTRLRLAPFIVTLGTMSMLRGAAKGIAKEQTVSVDARGLDALLSPPEHAWMIFPAGVWITAVLAVLGALVLRYTRFGRHVFAVGSNEATARLCGVEVDRVKLAVYALAGALVGVAGLMEFSTLTLGDPTTSVGLELEVIAAVVIGGASLAGGEGSIAGAMAGASLMTVIKTGCQTEGLPNWVQEIVTGAIIVVAVALDRVRQERR